MFKLCRCAHLRISLEKGHGLTRPAVILIAGWGRGKLAALDITITSPFCPAILGNSSHHVCAAALAAEAGRVRLKSSVMPLPDSTLTPRWARWQNSTITLRRWLWRVTTSPPCLQVVAWLPRRSFHDIKHKSQNNITNSNVFLMRA